MHKIILRRTGLIISLSIIALCQAVLFAQTESGDVKLVTSIEVKGNKSISSNTVISKIKTKIGSPYQENVVNDDFKRLYSLGYFEDIKIDKEEYRGGFKVMITVKERPIIERISFSGMRRMALKDEKLKDMLKSKETQYLDYPSVSEDINTLKKLYEKKGYAQIEVDSKVDVDNDTNKAKLRFTVREGKRIKIKDIFVEGNKMYPDSRILKLIKTKKAWLFNAGVLKEEVIKEDMERIKSFYHKEGYADVVVDFETRLEPQLPFLYVNIKIQEGSQYFVGDLSIKGNKDILEPQIRERLKECLPGKLFSQEALKDDVLNLQGLYYDHGYISVQVQEATSLNPQTGRIDITYNITENEVAYVDKIKIRGNVKIKDVVI